MGMRHHPLILNPPDFISLPRDDPKKALRLNEHRNLWHRRRNMKHHHGKSQSVFQQSSAIFKSIMAKGSQNNEILCQFAFIPTSLAMPLTMVASTP
jgi:hypothetical protein